MLSVQNSDFDAAELYRQLRAEATNAGAIVTFSGLVREFYESASPGKEPAVQALVLEHYPGMTEKSITAMMEEAAKRFDIHGARVIHRIGLLQPQDQIVLVAVTSAHRGMSFQACEFLMDYLKTQAPFWKKEVTPEGARWVDARVSDDKALARWGITVKNV